MRLSPAIWPLICVLVYTSSTCAAQLPSEVDVRSAYCEAVLKDMLRKHEAVLGTLTEPQFRKALQKEIVAIEANLRLLQRYLLPRLRDLDPSGLTAAMQSGQEDAAQCHEHERRCAGTCLLALVGSIDLTKYVACLGSCYQKNPAWNRTRVCESLHWLPF